MVWCQKAEQGPAERVHLSQEEIQLLGRTVRRAPEVMVKVLTKVEST